MEDKELIMMLEIGEGKMAFQNAGNDLEIWDLLPVLGRPRLGGRVVDLRTCSPNIWKTSENTTFPGREKGLGTPQITTRPMHEPLRPSQDCLLRTLSVVTAKRGDDPAPYSDGTGHPGPYCCLRPCRVPEGT